MDVSEAELAAFEEQIGISIMGVERMLNLMNEYPDQERNAVIAVTSGFLDELGVSDRELACMGVVAMVMLREERQARRDSDRPESLNA